MFALERLGPPAPAAAKRRGRGLARMLLAPEPLPRDALAPPRRRREWLRLLFALESLERVPAALPPPRRARWLKWLFALEPLDPP